MLIDSDSFATEGDGDSLGLVESGPVSDDSRGAIADGATLDHRAADAIAAKTETPAEAAIDAANGLRGHGGRRPVPEDFDGLLTPEGNSGDIVGRDIDDDSVFSIGEDGATKGTLQDGS